MSALPLTFTEFYPCYLREYSRRGTQILHFAGTTLFFGATAMSSITGRVWLLVGIGAAYSFAWVGHFVVEYNRPAMFQRPWYSLLSDFRMYFDLWRVREKF